MGRAFKKTKTRNTTEFERIEDGDKEGNPGKQLEKIEDGNLSRVVGDEEGNNRTTGACGK